MAYLNDITGFAATLGAAHRKLATYASGLARDASEGVVRQIEPVGPQWNIDADQERCVYVDGCILDLRNGNSLSIELVVDIRSFGIDASIALTAGAVDGDGVEILRSGVADLMASVDEFENGISGLVDLAVDRRDALAISFSFNS